MNGRQVALVLTGVVLFLAGAFVGLTPASPPVGAGAAVDVVPFLDPNQAVQEAPVQLLVAIGLVLLGPATALGGAYVVRQDTALA